MADQIDAIIKLLGVPLLRELKAIAHACDSMADGKLGLITPHHRRHYQAGGECAPLVETGCVVVGNSYVACHERRMLHVHMTLTGRRVLRRCAALRIDLTPEPAEDEDHDD